MEAVPPDPTRRGFLQAGAGTALLCTIGGKGFALRDAKDAEAADAAARAVARPRQAAGAGEPADALKFGTPQPQPGGVRREYWIQARTVIWDIAPTGRDDWHGHAIPKPRAFKAVVYQLMTAGFAKAAGPAAMPGPTLVAEVGDTLVVHFRNNAEALGQALTMHPHGVRYTPDYDGVYLGGHTRAGGFIAPGEEFTYTWEAVPGAVGAWAYHDHGPNHTLNSQRGLFGCIVIREKGAPGPDAEFPLFLHALQPPVTGLRASFQCINGRAGAGNTPTLRSKVGQDVAMHVFGADNFFHDFHVHGHRWKDSGGASVDTKTIGPSEGMTARWTEDNPGRWLYHCHVFSHQDAGMAGWYFAEP
jgi:FtsP/CotA-like multicopper oxidase with cupredoxin domain